MWDRKTLEALARSYAEKNNLDPDLVFSIIAVESSWNPFAIRFEPHTDKYVMNAYEHAQNNNISKATEEKLQMFSYGLMQTMGFLCRELGFRGNLIEISTPELGLMYGCQYLKKQLERYGDEASAIAAYNAGSARKLESGLFVNYRYLDKVYMHLNNYRRLKQ